GAGGEIVSRRPAPPARAAMTAGAGAVLARAAYAALRRRPPGGAGAWARANPPGGAGTLLGGPAPARGGAARPGVAPRPAPRAGRRAAGRAPSAGMTTWPAAVTGAGSAGIWGRWPGAR